MTAKIIRLPRRGHGLGCVTLARPEDIARPVTMADVAWMEKTIRLRANGHRVVQSNQKDAFQASFAQASTMVAGW